MLTAIGIAAHLAAFIICNPGSRGATPTAAIANRSAAVQCVTIPWAGMRRAMPAPRWMEHGSDRGDGRIIDEILRDSRIQRNLPSDGRRSIEAATNEKPPRADTPRKSNFESNTGRGSGDNRAAAKPSAVLEFLGSILRHGFIIIVVVAILIVAWNLRKKIKFQTFNHSWFSRKKRPESKTTVKNTPVPAPAVAAQPPGTFEPPDPELHARAGRFADAIHATLLQVISELQQRRVLPAGVAHTAREMARRPAMDPGGAAALQQLVFANERCHFGAVAAGGEDYRACRELQRSILGAAGNAGAAPA